MEDLQVGVSTIRRRSEGLLKFAETYRSLNKITTLNLTKVYARDLFENLHVLMEPTFEQKNIEMEIILKDPDLSLEADTSLIEQVLINLVVNAVEAMESEKGLLTVSLSQNLEHTTILIRDNGSGIREDDLKMLFEPYFTTKKSGMGLGLVSTLNIIKSHKAHIEVDSKQGMGTAFRVIFPN